MKRTFLALETLLLVSTLAATAQARPGAAKRPYSPADNKQSVWQYRSSTNPRLEYLHSQCQRPSTAGCHPSRAAVLVKTLVDGGATSANRPTDRKQLAVLAKHLSPVERKDLARFWLVEANYQKYQQQRARNLPAAGGTDRPRDPWLDKLARQEEGLRRTTGKSGK